MRIFVGNLGPLQQAEFELGDLTIICGENNTGKTYATYALYGFLSGWREAISISIPEETIRTLLSDGVVHMDVAGYGGKNAVSLLEKGCRAYTERLPIIFAATKFISENHSEILCDFSDIIGGEYTVTRNDQLYFLPRGKRGIRLTMDESSSAVRSLLDIGFYLKHLAKPGDILMVDEPELNLHPENQRRIARLFARLVNIGIKVFMTTHSDYLIKELNTLIMLDGDRPHLKGIAEREGYLPQELLPHAKIKVYIAEEGLIKQEGKKRRTRGMTLTPADIDPELGIEVGSFDKTIGTMNRIQDEIIWGEE